VVKVVWHKPHRRRRWTVQSYSPDGASAYRHLIHASLDPPESTHLDRFSRFCATHGRESLYFTLGRPFPLSIASSHWGSGPRSNTWFPGPTQVHIPNDISIGSAVFARLTIVADRQTNRPRYSVCNNRPRLRCTAMWRNNSIISSVNKQSSRKQVQARKQLRY